MGSGARIPHTKVIGIDVMYLIHCKLPPAANLEFGKENALEALLPWENSVDLVHSRYDNSVNVLLIGALVDSIGLPGTKMLDLWTSPSSG